MNRAIVARAVGVLGTKCWLKWGANETNLLYEHGVTDQYSSSTTNILIVRDPWTRAVSSYGDQKRRKNIPLNMSFTEYLETYATAEKLHHTGSAATKCPGMKDARFDYIINLEDISSFARVARLVPSYGSLVDHGWERCTKGDPRLYMPGSVTNKNKDQRIPYELCTPEHIQKVCGVYAADYELYARLGYPFECQCQRSLRGD